MPGFTLAAITDAEKTKLRRNNEQSQWTVKYRSRSMGQGACLKGMSRTITVQARWIFVSPPDTVARTLGGIT